MIKYILLFSSLFLVLTNSLAQSVDSNYVDGALYLKLNDTTSNQLDVSASSYPALASIFSTYSVTSVQQPFININVGLSHTYRLSFTQINSIQALIVALGQIAYVDYAEPVPLFYTSQIPNDFNSNQWYLTKINATQAWDLSTGNSNIKIAIVDNAVSTTHEDLSSSIAINTLEIPNNGLDDDFNGYIDDYKGYDAANGDGDVNPPASATTSSPWIHGTHCSGIASASTNNGVGIAGIGYNCSIIPVKCTPNSSAGNTLSAAYEGVAYAMNAGANIISMSFGSSGSSITGQNVISAAYLQGVTLVAAAGNDNSSAQFFPAAYSQVISVGATDISDQRASFSNFGSTIDVMAPGVGIYSTISGATNAYTSLSGTSMACPLVAGLCGLIKSQNITRTPDQIKAILNNGCENIDAINPNYVGQLGAGRINAFYSLVGNFLNLTENKEITSKIVSANPFLDYIEMKIGGNEMIVVRNSNGQLVEQFKPNDEIIRFGESYGNGIYFVQITNGNSVDNLKIVKL